MASVWLPLNSVTKSFWYINSIGKNQRVCVSAKTDRPLTYKISKVNDTKPIGIVKVTLDQDNFNQFTDYIERDKDGYIIGMWADYYANNIGTEQKDGIVQPSPVLSLSTSNQTLRVGGSYKTVTATIKTDAEITDQYNFTKDNWSFLCNGSDIADLVTVKETAQNNAIKIKFANDRSYIGKNITVRCTVDKMVGEIQLSLIG